MAGNAEGQGADGGVRGQGGKRCGRWRRVMGEQDVTVWPERR